MSDQAGAPNRDFLIVMNAAAGNADEGAVDRAVEQLRRAATVDVGRTRSTADLDELLDRRGNRILVVAGGDGSLHAVVAALWRRRELDSTVVGLLPMGTGNDFARGTGLPLDGDGAVRVLLEAAPAEVDLLIDSNDHVVVNAVHLGVGVEAAREAGAWKSRLGRHAFAIGALVAGIRTPGIRLDVHIDGKLLVDRRRRVLQVAIGNSPSVGGGTSMLPGAAVDDGRLDVVVSAATGRLARLGYAVRLKLGRHPRRSDVWSAQGTSVSARGDHLWCNADGELYGPKTELCWRVEPGALHMLLPH